MTLNKGVIAGVPESQAVEGFYSTLFLVPRRKVSTGQWSTAESEPPFEDGTLKNGRDAYCDGSLANPGLDNMSWPKRQILAILVHHDHRKFLRFRSGIQSFQFKALPFGLSTAPRVFNKVLRLRVGKLWSMGVRCIWTTSLSCTKSRIFFCSKRGWW